MSIKAADMPKQDILPVLDRVLSWSVSCPLPVWARYSAATLLITAVGLLRVLMITSAVPWLLFMPAVLGIALLLGRAPGVYAALLAIESVKCRPPERKRAGRQTYRCARSIP